MNRYLILTAVALIAVAFALNSLSIAATPQADRATSLAKGDGDEGGCVITEEELLEQLTEEQAARYRELRDAMEEALQAGEYDEAQRLSEELVAFMREVFGDTMPEPPEGEEPVPDSEQGHAECEGCIVEWGQVFEGFQNMTDEQKERLEGLQTALQEALAQDDRGEVERITAELASLLEELLQAQPDGDPD